MALHRFRKASSSDKRQIPDDGGKTVLSVTELTSAIKTVLEGGFSSIMVQGELSNTRLHTSGHFYFTLKDAGAQVSGVMWRSRVGSLAFRPDDGMKVIVSGRISVYEVRGVYQIDAWSIKPLGVGELQLAFEKLKQKLQAEGLFDLSRKRPVPSMPGRIGIVTSESGAALHDMLTILGRRFPSVEVIFRPAQVQGMGASADIAAALDALNAWGDVDVIIVGRGGGSLEDLWTFNEEEVARAIVRSHAPVISAVGHEVDFTIADFVADLRAPTPSAAAELVVPDRRAILDQVLNSWYTISKSMGTAIEDRKTGLSHLLASYAFTRPADLLHQYSQHIDDLQNNMSMLVNHRVSLLQERHGGVQRRLEALDPMLPLHRGFALVRKERAVVSRAQELTTDDDISIEFRDGIVRGTVL